MTRTTPSSRPGPIPACAGIGLRAPHYREILETLPDVGWLEVHSENYFGGGGPPLHYLERIRPHYPLSLHGVGLSLGSTDPLNTTHLRRLDGLVRRFEPALVSDHLCWSSVGGVYLNDLLPLPYTEEALAHVSARVVQVQEALRRPILVENVSSYLRYRHSTIPEPEFLCELATRSGCGILLDVNNVYVSASNHGFDAESYIDAIPATQIMEIHLAGFAVNRDPRGEILIDDHGSRVAQPVWRLFQRAIARFGPRPALLEWDTRLPALSVLLDEAERAQRIMEAQHAVVA
jgi:uncharacterized protein (UPF0276 family)